MTGFEVVIYIVAQTIPLLRVMFLGSASTRPGSIAAQTTGSKGKGKFKDAKPGNSLEELPGTYESHELVVLATGKVVLAGSEEGKAFQAAQAPKPTVAEATEPTDGDSPTKIPDVSDNGMSSLALDDETHQLWAGMGLSRRAWSKSPTASPEQGPVRRRPQPSTFEVGTAT